MQKVTTFNVGVEDGITIDGNKISIGGRLRRQVLGIWNRLQKARSVRVDQTAALKPEALLAFYHGPYEGGLADVPVVIFRRLE
jgi:hypothetical protein